MMNYLSSNDIQGSLFLRPEKLQSVKNRSEHDLVVVPQTSKEFYIYNQYLFIFINIAGSPITAMVEGHEVELVHDDETGLSSVVQCKY